MMAQRLQLIYYGHYLLREKAMPIEEITPEIHELVEGMLEVMDRHPAAGISANQVGKLVRLFIFCTYENLDYEKGTYEMSDPIVCINPRILELSDKSVRAIDNCLSVPGVDIYVSRPDRVVFEALDLEGKTYQMELEGYNARVFLHENDHLDGVLNVDHISKDEFRMVKSKLNKINKKYNKR